MPALCLQDQSGVRIVPHGDAAEEFCLCSFVRASASGYAAVSGLLVLPGYNRGALPLLCADGPVFLPECPVVDAGGGFAAGGYLGIVACDVAVTHPTSSELPAAPPADYPVGQTETIRVEALGVIPAAYSSGLRLDGIDVPPQTQSRLLNGTVSLWGLDPQPFRIGTNVTMTRVGVLNRLVAGESTHIGRGTFDAQISGLVGTRIRAEAIWPFPAPFDPIDKFTDSTTPWNQQS